MELSHNAQTFLVIGICAVVTYAIRIGGLLLADRLPEHGKTAQFLEALPGTILMAFIAPDIIKNGIPGIIAAAVIAFLSYKTRNVLIAAGTGTAFMIAARFLLSMS